ncbi:MAG TPA: DUF4282 domain-containing protein [Desulfosporosinus sp.]
MKQRLIDCGDYSEESFELIYNILLARGEDASPQPEQVIQDEDKNFTLGGFFSFRCMISSKLIQSFYIIGVITITIACWILFMKSQLFIGGLSIIVGNVVWRLACEMATLIFRMNEQLGLIQQELNRSIH